MRKYKTIQLIDRQGVLYALDIVGEVWRLAYDSERDRHFWVHCDWLEL